MDATHTQKNLFSRSILLKKDHYREQQLNTYAHVNDSLNMQDGSQRLLLSHFFLIHIMMRHILCREAG